MFCQHLGGIAAIVRQICSTDVVTQTPFQRARAGDAFLQHLHTDAHVGHRVEGSVVATEIVVLVVVHTCHDLHEALSAHRALRERVKAGFHRHDGENQGRIKLGARADGIGLGYECGDGLWRHAVLLAEPVSHLGLFTRKILGVGGGGALDSTRLDGRTHHGDVTLEQPCAQAFFAHVAQVRTCCHRDTSTGHTQTEERKAAVGQLHETVHDV